MSHGRKNIHEYDSIVVNGTTITTDQDNKLVVNDTVVEGGLGGSPEVDSLTATGTVAANDVAIARFLHVPLGTYTQTLETDTVVIDKQYGVITTPSLSTAAGNSYTFDISYSYLWTGAYVLVGIKGYSGNAGTPYVYVSGMSGGDMTVTVCNIHPSEAFNGVLMITYQILYLD